MKILLITPVWGHLGGLERYVADCVEELSRLGHECSIAFGRRTPVPVEQPIESSLRAAHHFPYLGRFTHSGDAHEANRLEGILSDGDFDVIFMTGVRNFQLLASLRAFGKLVPMSHDCSLVCMRMTSTTYVRRSICTHKLGPRCLLHGCSVRKNPDDPSQQLIYNSLGRHQSLLEIYRSMDVHLVNSEYIKARLIQHGFRAEQLIVVGCFTNIEAQTGASIPAATPVISFAGRINRYKGAEYLIKALARISTPYRCTIIGEGERLRFCRDLAAKLGIAKQVEFLGRLSTEEMTAHLQTISVAVVPSIFPEPFGIVGLEAMMARKPVVAFDVGGISDWLKNEETGYLVPVRDTQRLANRIESLLLDPDKAAAMGEAGHRIVTREFSKQRHFERLLAAFTSIGKANRPKAVFATRLVEGEQLLTVKV